MENLTRRTCVTAAALAPVALGLLTRASGSNEAPRREVIPSREILRERYFPNLVLTTHEGRKVRFYDDLIKDRIVTINVMYTECEDQWCPLTTDNLVRVQRLLKGRVGRDIFMYSITLEPEHDSPAALTRYAREHGVGPGWTFLTGEPRDIEVLRRKLGFSWADPVRDAKKVNHTGNLRYGNEPLQLWAACPTMANPKFIAESISWVDWPKAMKG